MKQYLKYLTIVGISLLVACAGNGNDKKNAKSSAPPPPKKEVKKETAANDIPGKKDFETSCAICHMKDGKGLVGTNPPLTNSTYVNGPKEKLINIVLHGLNEPIEIDGHKYTTPMAPMNYLSDDQIAGILTYVRSNFENKSGPITPDEVKALR